MSDTIKKSAGAAKFNIALVACALLAVMGIALYAAEHMGAASSNLTNFAPWGLYLSCFMLFAGIGAGCLMVASAPKAFGVAGLDAGIERLMAWIGFAALLTAGVFITVDLGSPLRMWELIASPHPASPLFWDVLALPVAIVLALVYVFVGCRAQGAAGRAFRAVVFFWGVFVLCVDAWILCSQGAHEAWNTAILMPWFVVTGALCGVAVQAVACALMGGEAPALRRIMAALIAADLLMYVFDLACGSSEATTLMTTGVLAPLFWAQVVLYAVAFMVCVLPSTAKSGAMATAGVLVLVGVLCKRIALMTAGFQLPALALPNASLPYVTDALVYAPAATEMACALGFCGLAVLIVLLGARFLNLAKLSK